MNPLIKISQKKLTYIESLNLVRTVLVLFFTIFLFLLILTPFGIIKGDGVNRLIEYLFRGFFGSVSLICSLFFINKNAWCYLKEIKVVLLSIVFATMFEFITLTKITAEDASKSFLFSNYLYEFYLVLIITLFCYFVIKVLIFSKLLYSKKKPKERLKLFEDTIILKSRNSYFKIKLTDLFFIEAYGNYSKIFTDNFSNINSSSVNYILIEKSLKEIMLNIEENDLYNLYRCHRSYIVNINKIDALRGNLRNSHLSLHDKEHIIPVSRTKIEEIRELLF